MSASKSPTAMLMPFGAIFALAGGFIFFKAIFGTLETDDGTIMPPLFGVLFSVPFLAVGLGAMGYAWYARRIVSEAEQLRVRFPGQPWKHKRVWHRVKLPCHAGKSLMMIGFAVFWNAISWVAVVAVFMDDRALPKWVSVMLALFPLIGLVLAVHAIRLTLRYLRWKRSTFELASLPGVIGGSLGGVIETSEPISSDVTLQLKCEEWVTDSQGYNSKVTVWETEVITPASELTQIGRGTTLPVLIEVPYNCPEYEIEGGKSWRLMAKAKTRGPDFEVSFDVPMFRTPNSDPAYTYGEGRL